MPYNSAVKCKFRDVSAEGSDVKTCLLAAHLQATAGNARGKHFAESRRLGR
jgi:hypothetical protein